MSDKLFHFTDGGLKNVWLANGCVAAQKQRHRNDRRVDS